MKIFILLSVLLHGALISADLVKFDGYFYPKPLPHLALQLPPRVVLDNTITGIQQSDQPAPPPAVQSDFIANETGPNPQLPAGVQGDFIDDLVADRKQQIFSSLASETTSLLNSNIIAPIGENKQFAPARKCSTCTCGVPNINRIVGGTKVKTNKYPWIAQMLGSAGSQFCGATLINDRYALTAAHCVYGMDQSKLSIRLLQLDVNSISEGILRRVSFVNMHRQYNPTTLENDIALLKFDQPIPLNDPIRPVCLPTHINQNFDFKNATVAGWGLTSDGGVQSSYLQEVNVPVLTNAQCRATSYKSMIVETMLCAGYLQGGKDACQGDSGGPLIIRDSTIYRLAGVVSFGYGCAMQDAPGVYTRVSKYLDWIAANTRDGCYCSK